MFRVWCLCLNILSFAGGPPCQHCYSPGTCNMTPSMLIHISSGYGCQITSVYRVWCLYLNVLSLVRGPLCQKSDASNTCRVYPFPSESLKDHGSAYSTRTLWLLRLWDFPSDLQAWQNMTCATTGFFGVLASWLNVSSASCCCAAFFCCVCLVSSSGLKGCRRLRRW